MNTMTLTPGHLSFSQLREVWQQPVKLRLDASAIDGSVDSLDWKDYGVKSIVKMVCNNRYLGNGAIILLHNGAKYTPQALSLIIEGLESQGYEIVPISQLLIRGSYHLDHTGKQIRD